MRRRLTVSGKCREYLSDEMAESYAAYRGRLRRGLGKAAEKLVKITDKYLPRITDEARVYIMKFPHKIPVLLKQTRKVRKKAKSRAAFWRRRWIGTSSEASDSRADSQAPLEGEIPALQSPSRGMTRPRTPSRSPTRSSPRSPARSSSHLGGMRPRTPSRSPRRNVRLVPNQHWRNVQEVQAHMARSRSARPS